MLTSFLTQLDGHKIPLLTARRQQKGEVRPKHRRRRFEVMYVMNAGKHLWPMISHLN